MMLDDGSVPEFARYGGYITSATARRFQRRGRWPSGRGASLSRGSAGPGGGVTKYLPATRSVLGDWSAVEPEGRSISCARPATSSICGTGGRSAPTRSTSPTISSWPRPVSAIPGRSGYPPTGTATTSSRADVRSRTGRLPGAGLGRCGRRSARFRRHLLSDRGSGGAVRSDAGWQEGDTIPRRILRRRRARAPTSRSAAGALGGRLLGRDAHARARHRQSARRQDLDDKGSTRRLRDPPQCHRRPLALRLAADDAWAWIAMPNDGGPDFRRDAAWDQPWTR
jgi:hypothetical protein